MNQQGTHRAVESDQIGFEVMACEPWTLRAQDCSLSDRQWSFNPKYTKRNGELCTRIFILAAIGPRTSKTITEMSLSSWKLYMLPRIWLTMSTARWSEWSTIPLPSHPSRFLLFSGSRIHTMVWRFNCCSHPSYNAYDEDDASGEIVTLDSTILRRKTK